MAEENYRRLSCASCDSTFLAVIKQGKPYTKCEKHRCRKPYTFAPVVMAKCATCGIDYRKRREGQFTCSVRCRKMALNPPRIKRSYECSMCGVSCKSFETKAIYCGTLCKVNACKRRSDPLRGTRYKAALDAKLERKNILAKTKEYKSRLAEKQKQQQQQASLRECAHCGVTYCALKPVVMKYCGEQCKSNQAKDQKRTARLARKAIQRASSVERVSPNKVFTRDGWSCYLCGCHTPSELRGSYMQNAPELEHVVPLSRGGEHSYANVRCACRACNLIKGDKTLDEIGGEYIPTGGVG